MAEHSSTLYVQPKDLRDGATPSGNSIATRVLNRLTVRTGNPEYKNKANQTLNIFSSLIVNNPSSSSTMLATLDEIAHGETGAQQYGARGVVKATARLEEKGEDIHISIRLDIAENWHVNSHRPRIEDIIPTNITLKPNTSDWEIKTTRYPEPVTMDFKFSDIPLEVYHGTVQFEVRLAKNSNETENSYRILPLQLTFQACDDQTCLAPETLVLRVAL